MNRANRFERLPVRAAALALATLAALAMTAGVACAQRLSGWASLPAATFSDGPDSGQATRPNPWGTNLPPWRGRQPVQGFSAILAGRAPGTFRVLVDNGFGARANSGDFELRAYAIHVDWRSADGGAGTVHAADWSTGTKRAAFDAGSRIVFHDAGGALTGADFDPESFREDGRGHLWLGDEFGPWLLETDASGRVLGNPFGVPGVRSPEHPDVRAGRAAATLPGSGGFEGLALSCDGARLYGLLEKTVAGDVPGQLRLIPFDLTRRTFEPVRAIYPLEQPSHAIGDLAALADGQFLVIERNSSTATTVGEGAPFKRIYRITLPVEAGALVEKTLLVDLMDLADPDDLDGDGRRQFDFPYVTIENLLVLDASTLVVANDNNFPYGGGRRAASDDTELLRIALDAPLPVCASHSPSAAATRAVSAQGVTGHGRSSGLKGRARPQDSAASTSARTRPPE